MYLSIEVTNFEDFDPRINISNEEIEKYKSKKKEALSNLKDYLLDDGNTLDGDKIQEHLFPETNVDIFLSHSHGDETEVIKLAILLERKGFSVFIDSCIWGNAFDLLEVIDKKYCYNTCGTTYNYQKRNYSTSHVYMMLNTALHKMIDKCEVFLFLGTPNSTSLKSSIHSQAQESLKSPWILSEFTFAKFVRRNSYFNYDEQKIVAKSLESMVIMDSLQVEYDKPKLDYEITGTALSNLLSRIQPSHRKIVLFKSLYSDLKKTY
ncbi:toll/interleukin-1 receptor domain-containing protein [Acinetobacter pollinis]|uniref:toll/interleukin-1 receptor domain-containing protein n=1 Tax=Acinetobacter pollinis TaxID=2605270 RepID=UPI0018A333F5|nr:toll/interleukin-1 receptor domain-containing protein [Acinetobacter pollinis]MBF7699274.1 toll/interleukin-1 receptor domain-containing protein [Acinetobacter pollinis]